MEKTDDIPLWVFLAFSSISTRKGALALTWASVVFSIYSIPWSLGFASQDWVAATIFLIDDWSWLAFMVPITFWYWMSLRWIDNNSGWEDPDKDQD